MKLPGGESLKMGLDLSWGLRSSHTDVEYFSLTLSFYYSGTQRLQLPLGSHCGEVWEDACPRQAQGRASDSSSLTLVSLEGLGAF